MRARFVAALAVGAAAALAAPLAAGAAQPAPEVGAWASAQVQGQSVFGCPGGDGGLTDQTVRNIIYPSAGGDRVRIRLSNVFGTSDLHVGAATVGIAGSGAAITGARHAVRFSGQRAVTVPPGARVLSDWVDMDVTAQRELAVSVYVPSFTGPATEHPSAYQNNFLSKTGDWSAAGDSSGYPATIPCWLFLDGVDVAPTSTVTGTVVGFGDSITDGDHSDTNANDRWTDELGRRLADRKGKTLSVVNAGIGGNEILNDSDLSLFGVSALARFERDALGQAGVKDVIVLEGINDIGNSDVGNRPHLTPAALIAGYRQLIAKAHAAGVRIIGGTLTPFKGALYWSQDGERTREQVNKWILTSGEFDGTVDFAGAVADPADPQVYNPAYDGGDHLHPNDAGYRAMGQAVDLAMLVRGGRA